MRAWDVADALHAAVTNGTFADSVRSVSQAAALPGDDGGYCVADFPCSL